MLKWCDYGLNVDCCCNNYIYHELNKLTVLYLHIYLHGRQHVYVYVLVWVYLRVWAVIAGMCKKEGKCERARRSLVVQIQMDKELLMFIAIIYSC